MEQEIQRAKSRNRWLILGVGLLLLVGSFRLGYTSGAKGYAFEPKSFQVVGKDQGPKVVDYNLLWTTVEKLNQTFLEGEVSPQKILYGAIKGAVSASGDPYTEFFTPEELADFQTDLKGEFDGIGAEIGKKNGNIVVIAPLDDTPAKRAGLRPQDIILKVNGELLGEASVEEAVRKIRGPKGTEVVLNIYREGDREPFDVKIVRAKIEIKSVKWEVKKQTVNQTEKKIGVITITRFGEDTSKRFTDAVGEILKQKVDGLVVDLRNNPGGFLDTAVELAGFWLPKGKLVVTEAKSRGENETLTSNGPAVLENVKTIVLVNGGSASASEILAGALKDHGKARLVGEKSFGKGSVQELLSLPEGSALKVTIAKWITPGGRNLNKDGLEVDEKVEMTDKDYEEDKDPQLDKALELLFK